MINVTEKTAGNTARKAVKSESRSPKAKKESRPLKRHFKYIIPEYRLVLVKEPGIKPTHISDPISFHHFVQPLAHYSEEHFIAFHLGSGIAKLSPGAKSKSRAKPSHTGNFLIA